MIGNYFDNSTRPRINSLSMSGILPAQSSWRYLQPVEFLFHLFADYSTLQVVYGIKVLARQDPYIDTAEKAIEGLIVATNPGSFLVDVIPMRASHAPSHNVRVPPDCAVKYVPEWFPGASFQTKARHWRQLAVKMNTAPFEAVKQSLVSSSLPSFFFLY
jgi:hypothetical protein